MLDLKGDEQRSNEQDDRRLAGRRAPFIDLLE